MNNTVLVVCVDPPRLSEYQEAMAWIADRVLAAGSFELAKETLKEARPDVVVSEIRLAAYNGLYLALWTRVRFPEVRIILVGGPDHILEGDAGAINATYVRLGDARALADAVAEALARERPRRRWRRMPFRAEVPMYVGDHPVRVIDLSYGGLRFELLGEPPTPSAAQLPVTIPQFGVRAEATCLWSRDGSIPGAWLCGAALEETQRRAGSPWRAFVDAVSAAGAAR